MKYLFLYLTFLLFLSIPFSTFSQEYSTQEIETMIEEYRKIDRGPYRDIRWFCKDGTTNEPKEPCEDEPGNQRARYKEDIIKLGKRNHIYLGQILATTDEQEFWDEEKNHSRAKQYMLEQFLKANDNGWINEKAQFYRGAYQIEDERAWGREFLTNRLSYDSNIEKRFYLLRQATQIIPHIEETNLSTNIRAVSKSLADTFGKFQDLRIKIHGQPAESDLKEVIAFRDEYYNNLNKKQQKQIDQLIKDMKVYYSPIQLTDLDQSIAKLSDRHDITKELKEYVKYYNNREGNTNRIIATSDLIYEIRKSMTEVSKNERLPLMDISNKLESIYHREVGTWKPQTTPDLQQKICYTAQVAAGTGLLEEWEWNEAIGQLSSNTASDLRSQLNFLETARRIIEWGTGTVNGVFGDVVKEWSTFETKAIEFIDDRIRSSALLRLGQQVGGFGEVFAQRAGFRNRIFDISNQEQSRGLNPGYAMGELVVVDSDDDIEIDPEKIYIFRRPSSNLKPVAGIATVTEGNMVSHVQLLARNLGIPNAVIANDHFTELLPLAGQKIFYAVSNRGTIVMKPASDMSDEEKELFKEDKKASDKITVPTDKIDLSVTKVVNMRKVDAEQSGIICGPKAANLGELKKHFPKYVVEGVVIPFGIFKEHLDQNMPNTEQSYWEFLKSSFSKAESMRASGTSESEVQEYLLEQLATLRKAILDIELKSSFVKDLSNQFRSAFGKSMGRVPVFLRSDTNMEDLNTFTGAGLNLTKFNVVDKDEILKGIREVWASPYTERSFKWRQSILNNPENVFPSILIIPSVDVDYSGVMITKGITSQDGRDVTVAFSRGAGGAVDGQAAESYLLTHTYNNKLLSPAREPYYRRLPADGGSKMELTTFHEPILNNKNLQTLRELAYEIHQKIPTHDGSIGTWDIELGFLDNKPWLFQVRPFVENDNAKSNAYLESIDLPDNT